MSAPGACDGDGPVRRLRVLEDKEALRGLLVRGWRALDLKDWGTWTECWAEDAVLEFGPWGEIRGREAIREKVEEAEAPFRSMQHHLLNTHFEVDEVDGDRATGIGYMWFVAVTGAATAAVTGAATAADAGGATAAAPYAMGGPYDWEFRRAPDGGWRVARQRLGVWWTAGEDTGPEAFG